MDVPFVVFLGDAISVDPKIALAELLGRIHSIFDCLWRID
jgi:hypothetical protein